MKYKLILKKSDYKYGMFSWIFMMGEKYAKWDRSGGYRTFYFYDEQDLIAFKLKFGI